MPDPDPSAALRARLLTMRVIHLALVAGCLSFAAIVIYLRSQPGAAVAELPVLSFAGIALATMTAMAAVVVPGMLAANARRELAPGDVSAPETDPRWWNLYQTRLIIVAALLEGTVFFQLVAFLVEGMPWNLGLGAVFLVGLALLFPTRERVERWIRAQHEMAEQERRL